MYKDLMYSGVVFLPYPSAILQGIDIAALLICDVRPYDFSMTTNFFGDEPYFFCGYELWLLIGRNFHAVFLLKLSYSGRRCGQDVLAVVMSPSENEKDLQVTYAGGRLRLLIRSLEKSNSNHVSMNDSKATL